MTNSPEPRSLTIRPDARAYAVIVIACLPVFVLWSLVWWKRGPAVAPPIALIAALVALGCVQLRNKAVTLDDGAIVQGWPPFRTRIAYHEIARIHHVFVSTRYASVACLAIAAAAETKTKEIVLPMKSFSLEKRRRLVRLLQAKAPQARIDPHVAA